MKQYNYSNSEPCFNLRLKETTRKWQRYAVEFPSAHPSVYPEFNTAAGEYFQPRGIDNTPLAILIHGVGGTVIPCQFLARSLVKKGIACFILYLVFHPKRMPQDIKKRFPVLTPEEWFEGYRISVINSRQIIDWATRRKEINGEQVATLGISLGGFISSIAMGIDKRIGAGVFIVTGGNTTRMAWINSSRAISRRYNYNHYTNAEYQDIQDHYRQYLKDIADKGLDNVTPYLQSFLTDPITFSHAIQQRPVLMLNARWDEVIPKQTAVELWESYGKQSIKWFPATHAGIWLWYPSISREITEFLSSVFEM